MAFESEHCVKVGCAHGFDSILRYVPDGLQSSSMRSGDVGVVPSDDSGDGDGDDDDDDDDSGGDELGVTGAAGSTHGAHTEPSQ